MRELRRAGGRLRCARRRPSHPARRHAATPTPTATEPALPALDPQGDATANLPFFSSIVAAVWATPQNVSGRAYIDALVAAGFDKGAMQVTQDQSTVGNPAESIQFSVVWKGECLVGQVGPATGQPVAVVLPVLADGSCLVGDDPPHRLVAGRGRKGRLPSPPRLDRLWLSTSTRWSVPARRSARS